MPQTSKGAANIRLIARTLIAALREQGDQVATQAEDYLLGVLGLSNVPLPTAFVNKLFEVMADHLEAKTDEVVDSSTDVLDEAADVKDAYSDERVATDNLRDNLIGTRSLIQGSYGSEVVAEYGLTGGTPEDPNDLQIAAESVESSLRRNAFPAQTLRSSAPDLDNVAIADELADNIARLESATDAIDTEERQVQAARTERNDAESDWKRSYRGIALITEGLFRLADADELADRIRVTNRRRRGRPEPEDLEDEEESTEEPVADEESDTEEEPEPV